MKKTAALDLQDSVSRVQLCDTNHLLAFNMQAEVENPAAAEECVTGRRRWNTERQADSQRGGGDVLPLC